jgi:uncharacterized membrane protein YphA (DoxX/SURF4 family)
MSTQVWPRWLLLAGRVILGAVMAYAAYTKLRASWLVFAGSLSGYQLLPDNLLEPIARALPWFELLLGVLLIAGILTRWSALLTTLLLGTFFGVMVRSYAAGLKIDCGCFGPGEALGPKTLIRDGSLVALSIAVTVGAFISRRRNRRELDRWRPSRQNQTVDAA